MEARCARHLRTFVGQVEQDDDGALWAVLYATRDSGRRSLLDREPVRSLRHGRRRVSDMVLSGADAEIGVAGGR